VGDKSKIEWTDATWNPVTGCTKISAGCKNCYMFREYPRLAAMGVKGYADGRPDQVRTWPEKLEQPLRWKKPKIIFVNSMSDLFHQDVPDEFIDKVFAIMALCPQHIFQVLTKRPERMFKYADACRITPISQAMWRPGLKIEVIRPAVDRLLAIGSDSGQLGLPLPNVWLGVSVEDQATADERIPWLLKTPASVRFVSYEPALGPVNFKHWMWPMCWHWAAEYKTPEEAKAAGAYCELKPQALVSAYSIFIDWVIAGGESGDGARPMHPDWARGARDQCVASKVPFFFKQWGEFLPVEWNPASGIGPTYKRVGKRQAGRELDGKEWDEMPARAAEAVKGGRNGKRSSDAVVPVN
jgi:protein gp37